MTFSSSQNTETAEANQIHFLQWRQHFWRSSQKRSVLSATQVEYGNVQPQNRQSQSHQDCQFLKKFHHDNKGCPVKLNLDLHVSTLMSSGLSSSTLWEQAVSLTGLLKRETNCDRQHIKEEFLLHDISYCLHEQYLWRKLVVSNQPYNIFGAPEPLRIVFHQILLKLGLAGLNNCIKIV